MTTLKENITLTAIPNAVVLSTSNEMDKLVNNLNSVNPIHSKANLSDWDKLKSQKKSLFVRFIDPSHVRYGSIAKINNPSIYSLSTRPKISGKLHFDDHKCNGSVYSYSELIEWLPGYNGKTEWHYDKNRPKYATPISTHYDRLNREIKVGDFCCYILYQFDGDGMANIYFGNVTRLDGDGSIWCKNTKLSDNERSSEAKVKNSKLITILTDDLMDQLLIAKLTY